jgi:hypothetical protein
MNKAAAIYARVSSDRQKADHTIVSQTTALVEYAKTTRKNVDWKKGMKIRLVAPVYFCASKLEAFAGRGANDFHGSRDLEDLIAVVDGRAELVGEFRLQRAMFVPTSPKKSRS